MCLNLHYSLIPLAHFKPEGSLKAILKEIFLKPTAKTHW